MLDNLDRVQAIMKLNRAYINFLKKHLSVIELSNNFFRSLREDTKKKVQYPSSSVKRALKKASVI